MHGRLCCPKPNSKPTQGSTASMLTLAASVLRQRHDKQMSDRNKKKVNHLTGEKRHRNDITNGQRVSRHSLPTLCFLFFSHRTFFKNNFSQPHKWHIWFCPTHKPTLRKTKRAIFSQRTENHKFDNLKLRDKCT